MNTSKAMRFGVIGVGYLGQHHARIYHELPQCNLVGVYDVDKQRAEEISTLYDCKAFDSPEALAGACDALSIVVPTDKHFSVAISALEQSCHLLVEKPFCASLSEAEQVLELAQKQNCIVQVGHIEQYNPVMGFLEKKVQEPRFITADRLAPYTPRGTEVGVVLDLMIHDIGIILKLVRSPIERIDCVGVNVISKSEDIANARITFENGCVANINTSRVSLKKVREIRVFQPFTYLSLDFMNQKGHLLSKGTLGIQKKDIPIEKAEPLKVELSSFADCVLKSTQPKVSGMHGRSALEVAMQITETIQAQQAEYIHAG